MRYFRKSFFIPRYHEFKPDVKFVDAPNSIVSCSSLQINIIHLLKSSCVMCVGTYFVFQIEFLLHVQGLESRVLRKRTRRVAYRRIVLLISVGRADRRRAV